VSYKSINFRQKFGLFNEQWQPKVIAENQALAWRTEFWRRTAGISSHVVTATTMPPFHLVPPSLRARRPELHR